MAYLGTYEVAANAGLSIDAPAVWNYDDGTPVRIVCYTNAAAARLLLNGKAVADTKQRDDSNGIIAWDIPFAAGKLEVEALDADGKVIATDCPKTTGLPSALRASIDADEAGLAHIMVEVVDDQGNIVPLADNMISCRVDGGATLRDWKARATVICRTQKLTNDAPARAVPLPMYSVTVQAKLLFISHLLFSNRHQ